MLAVPRHRIASRAKHPIPCIMQDAGDAQGQSQMAGAPGCPPAVDLTTDPQPWKRLFADMTDLFLFPWRIANALQFRWEL